MKNDGPINLSQPKLLLGEGIDEKRLFEALLKRLGLHEEIQVLAYHGKDKLPRYLSALRKMPNLNSVVAIGITRDADADSSITQQSIADAVQHAAFPTEIRTSVLVLPGNNRPGALEDVLVPALEKDPAWPCIENFAACRSEAMGLWPNHSANIGKAKVEAWLSTRDRPTLRLGEAAEAGQIPFESPAFLPLIAFIKSL